MIDLRSDTVTMPSKEMKEFMFKAPLGDDVYGDDPTINLLEKQAANIFGKEKAYKEHHNSLFEKMKKSFKRIDSVKL